jgi:hypothetical protein
MTKNGVETVLNAARTVHAGNPDIFEPAASFFNVDIDERLNTSVSWEGLVYEAY